MPTLPINAIGLPFRRRVLRIPLASTALFWLDGTLDGTEFVDRSGNGRNFTITNKDFTASYFPYKSAATISAPVGDATLFAADVNSFLYGVDANSPNEIPVVSFFQNIDYEDILFSRHVAQSVDGNGVETREPHVKDIAMYPAALTGSDLTTANSYYGVPIFDIDQYWIDPDGNDTTGVGSRANPWLTLNKGVISVNDTKKIYTKSGIYNGHVSLFYLYDAFANSIIGFGRVEIVTTSTTYVVRINNANIPLVERLYMNNPAALSGGFLLGGAYPLVLEKIYLNNNAAIGIPSGGFTEVNNSVFAGTYSNTISLVSYGTAWLISGNYFGGTNSSHVISEVKDGAVTFINNKFKNTGGNCYFDAISAGVAALIIKGNYFEPAGAPDYYIYTDGDKSRAITYNTLIVNAGLATQLIRIIGSPVNVPNVSNNTIDNTIGSELVLIGLETSAGLIENNIIDSGVLNILTAGIDMAIGTTTAAACDSAVINNNKILSFRKASKHIGIGGEATGLGDNNYSGGISIEKNYIKGWNPLGGVVVDHTTHGLFVGFQIDAYVRYNFCWGSFYGPILKGSTGTVYTEGGSLYNVLLESVAPVYIKGAQSVNVFGNTIVNKSLDFGVAINMVANTGGDEPDNCVIKNNIIIGMGTGTNLMISDLNAPGATNNVSDYNLFYCPNGTLRFASEGNPKTFSEWQALGYDANSKVLTDEEFAALFTDFDNNDFSLLSGSVAIGAGETLAATYDDGLDASTNWGDDSTLPVVVTKQQTAPWDIGAYVS